MFFKSILRFMHDDGSRRWNTAVDSIRTSGRSLLELEDVALLHRNKTTELVKMDKEEVYVLEKSGNDALSLAERSIQNEQLAHEVRKRIR